MFPFISFFLLSLSLSLPLSLFRTLSLLNRLCFNVTNLPVSVAALVFFFFQIFSSFLYMLIFLLTMILNLQRRLRISFINARALIYDM